ncbi:MAG TPA: hypothetical protein VLE89_07850 [Chlamydiales bacterium]|nr:hypothetical protein [Chlamydiales bacterium]
MGKQIAGLIESKAKPLAPIYVYEVDTGKGKPLLIEANRVDQIGAALTFSIEYSDYNVHVAGFSTWKSYRMLKTKIEPALEKRVVSEKKGKSPQFQFSI